MGRHQRPALTLTPSPGAGAPTLSRRQLIGRQESAAWLNALLASGWSTTLGPLLEKSLRDEICASLAELPLPRSLRSVRLADLSLGTGPPLLRAVACAPLPRGAPFPGAGCEAQLDLEWEDESASATFVFMPANVVSQPRLRCARPRLRGTLHVQWEWLPYPSNSYPHVGRVRVCFVSPPEARATIEPLGSLDVTQLPGLGHWLRFALRDSVNAVVTHPNWLETDMRRSSRDADAATPTPISPSTSPSPFGSPPPSLPPLPPPSPSLSPLPLRVVGVASLPFAPELPRPPATATATGTGEQ